jgi:SAM-dependent methyltransferase
MSFEERRRNWQQFGAEDPLWAVLTHDGKRGNRWDPVEFFETGRIAVEQMLDYAAQSGANVRHGAALDFGCGVGRLSQALATRFQSTVGVDVAESMLEHARKFNRYPDRCRFVLNTSPDLKQFEGESFDFILTLIALQHIEPVYVLGYLAEFLRLLKPGGVLVFQETSRKRWTLQRRRGDTSLKHFVSRAIPLPILGWYSRIKGRLKGQPPMHAYGISPRRIASHIESHGGQVLNVTADDWGGPAWISHHYCVVKPK